jgi:hypothetical protein
MGTVGVVQLEQFWSPEAIRAVRVGSIVDVDGTWQFGAVGHRRHTYPAAADAVCAEGRSHAVPDPDCGCGFWGCPDRDTLDAALPIVGRAVLDVTFSGVVVEHHLDDDGTVGGWRAERMEVLAVHYSDRCWCGAPADGLAFIAPVAGPPWPVAHPWCATCADRSVLVDALVEPEVMSEALGVPVDIADSDARLRLTPTERRLVEPLWLRGPTRVQRVSARWREARAVRADARRRAMAD